MQSFLQKDQARQLAEAHGTPVFVYSKKLLKERAEELLGLELPFGHTARYAVKANSHPETIRLFDELGLQFDASSSFEVEELFKLGIVGNKISLSSQQSADNLAELLKADVQYVATSMRQLELFVAAAGKGSKVALRVNPPVGYGHNNRLTTAGRNSSFGLWHEYLEEALDFAKANQIVVDRLHIHVGSGADPSAWAKVMDKALDIARKLPEVHTLDIGGGYKVAYSDSEVETDMQKVAEVFSGRLQKFADETGRRLKLETESGRWLVAHAGLLLARIDDMVDTGKGGHAFLKLNTGMNDIVRPAMYGAQHQIAVLSDSKEQAEYIVVGHNCETGDTLTTAPGDPESLAPRLLNRAEVGDLVAIRDAGAYCASFSTKGYNAFPSAKEILV